MTTAEMVEFLRGLTGLMSWSSNIDRLRQCADYIESANTWQPMATAPKDGTRIIVLTGPAYYDENKAFEVIWFGPVGRWEASDTFSVEYFQDCQLTGWRALNLPTESED